MTSQQNKDLFKQCSNLPQCHDWQLQLRSLKPAAICERDFQVYVHHCNIAIGRLATLEISARRLCATEEAGQCRAGFNIVAVLHQLLQTRTEA